MAAGVVLSILVARALGPAEMGSYALALIVVTGLEAVAGLGLARTTLKFAAELSGQPAAAPAVWWLLRRRAASGVLAAVSLAVAAPWLGLLFHDELLPSLLLIGSGLLLTNLLASVLESALEGSARFDLLARATFGITPVHIAATLAALAIGGGAWRVMVAQLLMAAINLAVLAALGLRVGVLAWRPGSPEPVLTARMTRFARDGYLLSLLTFVVRDRVEVLVLGALATTRDVGLYSVALGAAEAAMRLGPWIVATIYFPLFAVAWARSDRREAGEQYARCVRYLVLAAAPLCLGGIAVADAGVQVLFGSEYAPMVPVLRLTLVAAAAAAVAQGAAGLLSAADRQDLLLWIRGPLAAVNLLLYFALVPQFAATGAAWASLTVAVAEASLLGLAARRLGVGTPLATLGVPLLAAGAAAAVAALALDGRTGVPGLVIAVLAGAVVYVALLVAVRFLRSDDIALLVPWWSSSNG
jgi:O-antigen/teichoic acid export membrane protein